jgi:hypothetical protein
MRTDAASGPEVEGVLRCALSKREFISINRAQLRPTLLFVTLMVAAVIGFDARDGTVTTIWFAVFPLTGVVLLEVGARWRWRKIRLLGEPYEISWGEGEVTYENSTRRTTYKPGAFTKIDEGNSLVTLWIFDAPVVIVPNTCFSDTSQKQDLLRTARSLPAEPRS